jgi:hypothetical protein
MSIDTGAVINCRFFGNGASVGGGMSAGSGTSVINCTFVGNQALRLAPGGMGGWGGGMSAGTTTPVVNCTFANNSSFAIGGGVVGGAGIQGGAIRNCVLWSNTPDQVDSPGSVSYSDVQGGFAGVGNINIDPLFVDAANGNLRLSVGSPCIDAGDPAFVPLPDAELDPDGRIRVWDGNGDSVARVDMGAYEFGAPFFGDLNGDCVIDLDDLTVLLAHYGTLSGATYFDGDLDGNSDVDLSDLALLLSRFGMSCQ